MAESSTKTERSGIRLWSVIGAGVLVVSLVLWQVAAWQWERGSVDLAEEARNKLALQVGQLRGELKRFEVLPRLLASGDAVREFLSHRGDPERVDLMNRYLEEANRVSGAADTYLMDAEGLTLASSNWQSGTSFVGINFSYRPYFKGALHSGKGQYFALGTTSARRGFYFAAPVKTDGKVLGVIAVKVDIPSIEASWVPGFGEILVTDEDGVIFMATRPEWRYKSLYPLTTDALSRIRKSLRYPGVEHESLPIHQHLEEAEGVHLVEMEMPPPQRSFLQYATYVTVDEPMPEAGWQVHLMLPVVNVEIRVARILVLAAVFLAMVLLLVLFLRQRWNRKQERLRFEDASRRALEASESRVRAIIQNTHAGLITLDEDARIESINPTARAMFSLDNEDSWIGRPVSALFSGDPGLLPRLEQSGLVEVTGVRADGRLFPVEMAVRRAPSGEGRCLLVTLHDITERKKQESELREARSRLEHRVAERTADLTASNIRLQAEIEERAKAEQALREAQDQLIQAAKLASLGQMSASISHELNQPLAAIRTYADNAGELIGRERPADARWNLTQIGVLTERVARISSQLKAFARKASGAPESVSLAEAVKATVDIASATAKKAGVALMVGDISPGLNVWADRVQLEQVMLNLVTNGIQAASGSRGREVRVIAEPRRNQVEIRVQDSGPGIDGNHLTEIFEPFFTTKETGLGLGLSICAHLVESMNGQLSVINSDNSGAVFTLVVPVSDDRDITIEQEAI